MKSKLIALALSATCGAALAITLSVSAATQPVGATPPAAAPSQHYVEYRNDAWHFSLFVPDDWSANYDERSSTVQFIDAAGNEQFQISAWTYKDLIVHADGLNVQPPSSDGDEPDELGIVHIFNTDLFEIAFDKNGMSYNVQALPQNATSTLDILKTWEFI